jgi:hypothetical protein
MIVTAFSANPKMLSLRRDHCLPRKQSRSCTALAARYERLVNTPSTPVTTLDNEYLQTTILLEELLTPHIGLISTEYPNVNTAIEANSMSIQPRSIPLALLCSIGIIPLTSSAVNKSAKRKAAKAKLTHVAQNKLVFQTLTGLMSEEIMAN